MSPQSAQGLPLGRQRVLFVGGKGGVGKTTTAGSLGLGFAERGDRVLVVSTDPAHSLGDIFDRSIGDRETELAENLWGLEIDPDAQVESHLEAVKANMRELVKPEMYPEIDRQMGLAKLSPGAVEAAMLERMADLMNERSDRFDRVIFDTAPTGHTLRLLALPEIMAAWTDGLLRHRDRSDSWNKAIEKLGPRPGVGDDISFLDAPVEEQDDKSSRIRDILLERRRKFYQARRLLLDPSAAGFILVMNPEKLPILESQKAVATLAAADIEVLGIVVNRVLPDEPLGDFLEQRRAQEGEYLAQIDSHFGHIPQTRLPLLPHDVEGIETLRRISRALLPPIA